MHHAVDKHEVLSIEDLVQDSIVAHPQSKKVIVRSLDRFDEFPGGPRIGVDPVWWTPCGLTATGSGITSCVAA